MCTKVLLPNLARPKGRVFDNIRLGTKCILLLLFCRTTSSIFLIMAYFILIFFVTTVNIVVFLSKKSLVCEWLQSWL